MTGLMHSKSPSGPPVEPMPGQPHSSFVAPASGGAERDAKISGKSETPSKHMGNSPVAPNLTDTKLFVSKLDASGIFTFQAIPEAKNARATPTVLHGTLDEHAGELEALNRSGAGIFVMVNAGDGKIKPGAKTCRTQANVMRVRALFVDLDGAPLEPVMAFDPKPDLIVETSSGRWHTYWLVDDCELHEFRDLQKSLAERFKGDPAVCDLPRVMRLPGFWHLKSETPFLSRLVEAERLVLEEFRGA